MITYDFTTLTFVGVISEGATNEWALGPGRFSLGDVSYVAVGTNSSTDVSWVTDGAYVSVDSVGQILVVPGPALGAAAGYGFATAVMLIGGLLIMRWFARSFLAGHVPRAGE